MKLPNMHGRNSTILTGLPLASSRRAPEAPLRRMSPPASKLRRTYHNAVPHDER
eukprot:COSAG02_NODE_55783_length_288_cov_1.359788_1_plen_53_part_01